MTWICSVQWQHTLLSIYFGVLPSLHNLEVVCQQFVVGLHAIAILALAFYSMVRQAQEAGFNTHTAADLHIEIGVKAVQQGLPLVLHHPRDHVYEHACILANDLDCGNAEFALDLPFQNLEGSLAS
jgi:hypothetical protein